MRQEAPIEVRYAGIRYRVEPVTGDPGEGIHIVARPLTGTGVWWSARESVQLSESLPGSTGTKHDWTQGFKVNDSFFLPHALAQQILADKTAEEIDSLEPQTSPLSSR